MKLGKHITRKSGYELIWPKVTFPYFCWLVEAKIINNSVCDEMLNTISRPVRFVNWFRNIRI